jgi:hypothetical protein
LSEEIAASLQIDEQIATYEQGLAHLRKIKKNQESLRDEKQGFNLKIDNSLNVLN